MKGRDENPGGGNGVGKGRRENGPGGASAADRRSGREFPAMIPAGSARAAEEVAAIVRRVRSLPDDRRDRVAAIKAAIGSGRYVVDPTAVAARMVEEALGSFPAA